MLRRGPVYMVFAALAFTLMISAVKVARAELSAAELIVWRTVVALPVVVALTRGRTRRVHNRRVFALRAGLGFVAMTAFFGAIKGLSVADLSLIGKLQPVLVAIGAGVFLGRAERVGPKVWGALAVGLFGCGLLIGPELAVGSTWGLLALLAAVASAGAHICLRTLGATEDPRALVLWFQLALLPLGVGYVVATQGDLPRIPTGPMLPAVLAAGLCATAGQLLLTKAYALDRAANVAGASYAGPVWAVIVDVLAFGVWPTWSAVFGGLLVVGAGLALVRDRARAPAVEAPAPAPRGA